MRSLHVNPTIDRELELFHLGAAGVASYLNAVGRHQAEVIDFTFAWSRWEQVLRERLDRFEPDVLAISTVTPRMPSVRRIAQVARQMRPSLTVVLGGHHASLDTEGTVRLPEVDYVIIGEGELTYHALLDALEDGTDVRAIPSLAWIEDGEYRETPLGPLPRGTVLDEFPPMDWTLWEQLPRMLYHSGFLPMIGVRGCPYKCSFCSSPVLAQRLSDAGPFVRKRDARAVAEEGRYQWERHRHQGLRYLNFYDQNFLMNTAWLREFTEAYREMGMHEKLPFSAYSRVDHLTEERLELARQAGCVQLRLGIEAGDQYVRNTLLNKELDQEVLESKLELIRDSGIHTLGYFMIGTPGETPRQSLRSWRLARDSHLDRATFFFFTPLWDLKIMRDAGISVDYLEREESTTMYQGGELTEAGATSSPLQLKVMFYAMNGWFMLVNLLRLLRKQGPGLITGFPRYLREAKADDMDFKLALSQYVYFHGEAFPLDVEPRRRPASAPASTPIDRSEPRPEVAPELAEAAASSTVTPIVLGRPKAKASSTVDQTLY